MLYSGVSLLNFDIRYIFNPVLLIEFSLFRYGVNFSKQYTLN